MILEYGEGPGHHNLTVKPLFSFSCLDIRKADFAAIGSRDEKLPLSAKDGYADSDFNVFQVLLNDVGMGILNDDSVFVEKGCQFAVLGKAFVSHVKNPIKLDRLGLSAEKIKGSIFSRQ